jgi:hypothetical protein
MPIHFSIILMFRMRSEQLIQSKLTSIAITRVRTRANIQVFRWKCLAKDARARWLRGVFQSVSSSEVFFQTRLRNSIGKIIYDVGISLARACEAFGKSSRTTLELTSVADATVSRKSIESYISSSQSNKVSHSAFYCLSAYTTGEAPTLLSPRLH